GVDGEEDGRRHQDHDEVGAEVDEVEREEVAEALGVVADAGNEVAGALAAEELQGEALEVGVGAGAEVGADALGGAGEDVEPAPVEYPGHQGGGDQSAEVPGDEAEVGGLAVLVGDEDAVEQRHGQVGGDQAGGGAGEGEGEAQGDHGGPGPGEGD